MPTRLLAAVLLAFVSVAAPAQTASHYAITLDYFGGKVFWRLNLTDTNSVLTGDLDGDIVNGTRTGDHIKFHAYDKDGGAEDLTGTLANGRLTGTILWLQDGDPPASATLHDFTAEPLPTRQTDAKPSRHEFTPTHFYRQYSAEIAPVLHLWPGDTLHTTTVDAGGTDALGVHRSQGGNPQTGPFYIEGAWPGDTLVIHLKRLKLNRDYAISDDNLVDRASGTDLAVKMKDNGKEIRWRLDAAAGVATSGLPGAHLKTYSVPLKPMLGCIATAPGGTGVAIPTGDSGYFGGNMDFNEVTEGASVYLPVSVPGALLFFGDGHAAQGDGELNGNALETSMDVELSVDLIPGKRVPSPRVESDIYLMATGYQGSLDDALRTATSNMSSWLESAYKLTPSEISQVLGTAAELKITEVADRNAGIAVKIRKDRLATIGK